MATVTASTFEPALKELYTNEHIKDLTYGDMSPVLQWMKKSTDFKGEYFKDLLIYRPSLGSNSDFIQAQATKAGVGLKSFLVSRVKYYTLVSLDTEVILAADGNAGSLLDALETEIDAALKECTRAASRYLYGNGSGELGKISSTTTLASTSLILSNPDDVTNFEDGQILVFAANDTSALRDSGASLTINSIDRDTGTLTMSANLNTVTGIALADAIFRKGTYAAASDRKQLAGISAWIPDTAPSATLFFNVNRTDDVTRLAGVRKDLAGLSRSQGIVELASRLAREKTPPNKSIAAVSQSDFAALLHELDAKVEYTPMDSGTSISWPSIHVNGGGLGRIRVVPDADCPENKLHVLHHDSWNFKTLGEFPRMLDLDGSRMLREGTADAYEIRCGWYGNISNCAPGWNGVGINFGL